MSEMVTSVETQSRLRSLSEQLGLSQDACLNILLNHYELTLKSVPQRADFKAAFEEALASHGHLLDL